MQDITRNKKNNTTVCALLPVLVVVPWLPHMSWHSSHYRPPPNHHPLIWLNISLYAEPARQIKLTPQQAERLREVLHAAGGNIAETNNQILSTLALVAVHEVRTDDDGRYSRYALHMKGPTASQRRLLPQLTFSSSTHW